MHKIIFELLLCGRPSGCLHFPSLQIAVHCCSSSLPQIIVFPFWPIWGVCWCVYLETESLSYRTCILLIRLSSQEAASLYVGHWQYTGLGFSTCLHILDVVQCCTDVFTEITWISISILVSLGGSWCSNKVLGFLFCGCLFLPFAISLWSHFLFLLIFRSSCFSGH